MLPEITIRNFNKLILVIYADLKTERTFNRFFIILLQTPKVTIKMDILIYACYF